MATSLQAEVKKPRQGLYDALLEKAARRFNISRFELSKLVFVYTGLLPIVLIYAVLRIIPIIRSFILSAFDSNLVNPENTFVGLANYQSLLTDRNFGLAMRNTTLFAVLVVFFGVAIALVLGVLLAPKMRLGPFYEAAYFIPVITPMVAVSVIWKWIYDPSYGLLNYILSWFGITPQGWLIDARLALWSVVILSVWKMIGYNMVIFLVGIRDIPDVYYEAGQLDGANSMGLFRYITWPLLRPILLFVTVISTISAYNVFTQVYIMTTGSQGAPGNAVRTLVFDIYENAFRYFKFGYASAEAVALFLIVLVLTLLQFRAVRSD